MPRLPTTIGAGQRTKVHVARTAGANCALPPCLRNKQRVNNGQRIKREPENNSELILVYVYVAMTSTNVYAHNYVCIYTREYVYYAM